MANKIARYSNEELLIHAPDVPVRITPLLGATLIRAIADGHAEAVFEAKDARVTVNVHVEKKG